MYELTLKRRVSMFFGVLFLVIPLSVGGVYLTLDAISEYLSFPDVIIFSSLIIYGITCFFILLPLTFLSIPPIFLGRQASDSVQRPVSKFIIVCFLTSIIFQIGFRFYFINEFEKRGYIACQGIPSGWMPGMATKYAISEELCSKKSD
ncbi:Uncharacterised protein [Yersinia mollaretii]|nr:hypothetical protein CS537_06245 [Yersinia mollaretii]CNE00557.1 Uncharacterised protein [Yersinia mollaretii]CQJ21158.1 Uncharacterised protein [Yersinia mollaretii]